MGFTVPADVLDVDLGIAALIATTSGLIRGFAGFGSALVNAPLFALLFGPLAAVPMSAIFEFVATVQLLPLVIRDTDWRLNTLMGLAGICGIPVGAYILVNADEEIMRRVIAVIVLLLTFMVMKGWRFRGRPSDVTSLGVGAVTGSLLGSVGIGGMVPGLYLLTATPTAVMARATVISLGVFLAPVAIAAFVALDVIDETLIWRMALLLPAFMIASWIGARSFRLVSERLFRRLVLTFLTVVGFVTLIA